MSQVGTYLQNASEEVEISEDTEGLVVDLNLDIQIQAEEMVMLFVLGIGIVVISVSISSISIMRLKPREILTKMS